MVTVQKIQKGFIYYIDTDIMPQLPDAKRIVLSIYIALLCENIPKLIEQYKNMPAIKILGILDDTGDIDIDKIQNAYAAQCGSKKYTIDIPFIGPFKIDNNDVNKICQYIKEV